MLPTRYWAYKQADSQCGKAGPQSSNDPRSHGSGWGRMPNAV